MVRVDDNPDGASGSDETWDEQRIETPADHPQDQPKLDDEPEDEPEAQPEHQPDNQPEPQPEQQPENEREGCGINNQDPQRQIGAPYINMAASIVKCTLNQLCKYTISYPNFIIINNWPLSHGLYIRIYISRRRLLL